jgi:hypothetical protein
VFEDVDLFAASDPGPYDEQRFQAVGMVNALPIASSHHFSPQGDQT